MLLGIDVGTSSLKAMLFDPEGHIAPAVVREPLCVLYPDAETAELECDELWGSLVHLLGLLRQEAPFAWGGIKGIGLSVIFPALVPLDAEGRALHQAILYNDRRGLPQVNRIAAVYGRERFEAQTGNQLTPGTCTLPGLVWLRENRPEVFRRTRVFGQLSTFLIQRLTGEVVVDYTHASLSGLCSAGHEERWDPSLLELAGIGAERLPRLCPSTALAGTTAGLGARECGLPQGIPVAAGSGDAPLAAFGGGVTQPGKLFVSAGTTDCIMVSSATPSSSVVFCNIHGSTADPLWVVNGTMSTAGGSVQWFCERFAQTDPDIMAQWADQAVPGSRGLVYLPYLQGERTPWWNPHAKGVMFGLTLMTGREEAARAIYEGVACGWRQIITLLEAHLGTRPSEITVVGGGSTNPLWNRIKATALGRPLTVLTVPEITSLGAALCGGLCAGVFGSTVEAVQATHALRTTRTFEPVADWVSAAETTYALYEQLYPALAGLYNDHSS